MCLGCFDKYFTRHNPRFADFFMVLPKQRQHQSSYFQFARVVAGLGSSSTVVAHLSQVPSLFLFLFLFLFVLVFLFATRIGWHLQFYCNDDGSIAFWQTALAILQLSDWVLLGVATDTPETWWWWQAMMGGAVQSRAKRM